MGWKFCLLEGIIIDNFIDSDYNNAYFDKKETNKNVIMTEPFTEFNSPKIYSNMYSN